MVTHLPVETTYYTSSVKWLMWTLCIFCCLCQTCFGKTSWYENTRWKAIYILRSLGCSTMYYNAEVPTTQSHIHECAMLVVTAVISYPFIWNLHLSPSVDSQVPATCNKLLLETHTRLVTSHADERLICCTNTRQWKHVGRVEEKCTRILCSLMENTHWNSKANHFFPICIPHIVLSLQCSRRSP
jgi:hypothetical protein